MAQTGAKTWRCGNTYTDRPCEEGKAVNVEDTRSETDRRAADTATRRAETRADQLERMRLSREKAAYERDYRAAQDNRRAAIAERKLASSEQLAKARALKLASEPHKSSTRMGTGGPPKAQGEPGTGRGGKKKRKPSDSDAG